MNSDRHFYLYAKGHYEQRDVVRDLIKIQAHRCGIEERYLTLANVNITLIDLAYNHIKSKGHFAHFIERISIYINAGGFQVAIAQTCLLTLINIKTIDIPFDLGEPDPNILPLHSNQDEIDNLK